MRMYVNPQSINWLLDETTDWNLLGSALDQNEVTLFDSNAFIDQFKVIMARCCLHIHVQLFEIFWVWTLEPPENRLCLPFLKACEP